MKLLKTALYACPVLALAACGGGGHLSVENPGGRGTHETHTLNFPPGEPVEHRLPFRVSGGIPPYESSLPPELNDNCPGWVTLFPDQRILAGTAPAADAGGTFFCIYRVTESDPGFRAARSVDYGLRLRVGTSSGSDLSLPHPGRFGLSVGNFHSAPLPAATGGVWPYAYTFTCVGGALPPGMGFGAETRTFSGTPEVPFRDSCTYSVTDSSAVAATVSQAVEVEVAGPVTGTLMLGDPPGVDLSVGTFRDVLFPAAAGGVEPYTYTLACAGGSLPSGMSFAPETRRLAGTPGARFRDSCTYSVTDSSAVAATVSQAVKVEVGGPVTGTLELPASVVPGNVVRLRVNEHARVTFRGATGGVQPYTYELICPDPSPIGPNVPSMLPPPGLPPYDGLGFGPLTRVLSGTPNAAYTGPDCTYSVTDSATPPATLARSVALIVAGSVTGTLMLPRLSKVDLSVGTFRDLEFPAATGGVQPYTYAFECAGGSPPLGMNFAPATRRFAGTPDAPFRDSCTYSVTDSSAPAATVSRAVEVEVTGGATPLELTRVFEKIPGNELTLKIGRRSQTIFQSASGGVQPYTDELFDCTLPAGLEFHPSTRILSGTPDTEYRGPNCTYRVTDSSSPPASVSLSFVLTVEPLEASDWRFRTRTVDPGQGLCVVPGSGSVGVATLPAAHAGEGDASYALPGAPAPPQTGSFLSFDPGNRVLTYTNPAPPPVLGTPNTYRYMAGTEADVDATNADDALCLDVQYNSGAGICPADNDATPPLQPGHQVHIRLQVRDDAFWDENAQEYRCPDTTPPAPRSSAQGVSNPVHEALGPVHARRALDVAHGAVRDRVRGWTPGAPRVLTAIAPQIGIGSLSGESSGFDYTGSSESVSTGAEIGSGSWQAGLVGSYTRTELHYHAGASLAERGYRSGEHSTDILSLHPFAAWHMPSGGNVWTSLGAGSRAAAAPRRSRLSVPVALGCAAPRLRRRRIRPGGGHPGRRSRSRGRPRSLRLRDRGRGADFVRAAHPARARLARRPDVERAGQGRAFPVGGLQAPDGRRAGGRAAGDEGLGIGGRHSRSPPQPDLDRRGRLRPRRSRAQVMGPFRRRPLRPGRGPARSRRGPRHPSGVPGRGRVGRSRRAGRGWVWRTGRAPLPDGSPLYRLHPVFGRRLAPAERGDRPARHAGLAGPGRSLGPARDRLRAIRFSLRHRF